MYLPSSAQIEEGESNMHPSAITPSSSTENVNKVPVVKAKATHIIMNSLITSKSFCIPSVDKFKLRMEVLQYTVPF